MERDEIIKELVRCRDELNYIISCFDGLDSPDKSVVRKSYTNIVFTFFGLMDKLGKTEMGCYNYFKRRGWSYNGMQFEE